MGEETLSVWPGVKVGGWGDPLLPLKSNDIHCLPELELPTCDMGTPTVLSGLTAKRLDSSFSVSLLFSSIKFRYLERQPRLGRKPPPMTIHRNWSITCHWLYNYCYLDSAIWRKPLPLKERLSYLEGRAILYVIFDKYLSLCIITLTPYSIQKIK